MSANSSYSLFLTKGVDTVNTLQDLRLVIERAEYPLTRDDFEGFRRELLAIIESSNSDGDGDLRLHARLSPRETEVMTMLLEGKRLKEIGAQLGISVKTVTTHRARLLRKLHVEDNLGLYRYGIRSGLISA